MRRYSPIAPRSDGDPLDGDSTPIQALDPGIVRVMDEPDSAVILSELKVLRCLFTFPEQLQVITAVRELQETKARFECGDPLWATSWVVLDHERNPVRARTPDRRSNEGLDATSFCDAGPVLYPLIRAPREGKSSTRKGADFANCPGVELLFVANQDAACS